LDAGTGLDTTSGVDRGVVEDPDAEETTLGGDENAQARAMPIRTIAKTIMIERFDSNIFYLIVFIF
jgi:hypothetical protein